MPIYALGDDVPEIAAHAYVHPDAVVIGAVSIGAFSSIWPTAVLRGDYSHIVVGERTSIQDGTVLHVGHEVPTLVGDDCVVGHNAYLEGCIVESGALVGSNATVLHGVVVRTGAVIGAGAVLREGTEVPTGALALGVPAEIRPGAATRDYVSESVARYVDNATRYRSSLRRID